MIYPTNDDSLFHQGPPRGHGKIRFHDCAPSFERFDLLNVHVFRQQIAVLKEMLARATPDETQTRDIDFLLAVGEIFTLIVYAQLLLENAEVHAIDRDLVEQIFDVMVATCRTSRCGCTESRPPAAPRPTTACG